MTTTDIQSCQPVTLQALAALCEHPDFQEGMKWGRQMYYDMEYEGMLTEAEMVSVIEDNLTRRALKVSAYFYRVMELEPDPYLYCLGVVVGMIAEGCTAAKASEQQ